MQPTGTRAAGRRELLRMGPPASRDEGVRGDGAAVGKESLTLRCVVLVLHVHLPVILILVAILVIKVVVLVVHHILRAKRQVWGVTALQSSATAGGHTHRSFCSAYAPDAVIEANNPRTVLKGSGFEIESNIFALKSWSENNFEAGGPLWCRSQVLASCEGSYRLGRTCWTVILLPWEPLHPGGIIWRAACSWMEELEVGPAPPEILQGP